MAAHFPIGEPAPPLNTASFVSNEGETWIPGEAPAPTITGRYTIMLGGPPYNNEPRMHSTTPEELRQNFIEFLEGKLAESDMPDVRDTQDRLFYIAMLAVARDPTSSIRGLLLQDHKEPIESLKRHFHQVCFHLRGWNQTLDDAYSTKATGSTQAKGRSAADKNAQHIVPQWYGEACVLCGFPKPQGAHIVPVRAVKKASPYELWDVLSGLWPLSMVSEHELVLEGRECTNILPLCPNAHWLWDSHNFALRPIEDQDPEKRQLQMYLQVLWLKHHGSTDVVDILSDFRRVRAGPHPGIRHGDVYQLTTSDPTNQPLPNVRLLQIQLGVHKIYAGIRAAAEAGAIFRGNPPDDDGTAIPSGWTPTSQWQVALDAAVGAGALDVAAAERWRVAILQHELARIDNLLGKRSPLGSVDEGPEDAV